MKKILSIMIISLLVFACTSVCLLVLADTGLQESGEPSAETLSAETFSAEISVAPKTTLTTEEVLAAIERVEAMVEDPSLKGDAALTKKAYRLDYLAEVVDLAYTQLAAQMKDGYADDFDQYNRTSGVINIDEGAKFIVSSENAETPEDVDELMFHYLRLNQLNQDEGVTIYKFHYGTVRQLQNGEWTTLYPTAEHQAMIASLPTEAELSEPPYEMCYDLDPNGIPRDLQDYLLGLSPGERDADLSVSRETE